MICGQISLIFKQSRSSERNKKICILEEINFFNIYINTFRTIIRTFVLNKFLHFLDKTKEEEIKKIQMEIILPALLIHIHTQRDRRTSFLINSGL